RVHDDIGAKFDRAREERRRKGVVDQKWNLRLMRDLRDSRNVQSSEPAIAATAGRSSTSRPGLPIVSAMTSRVLGPIAERKSSSARGFTNVVVMPKRGSVCANRLMLPT